MEMIKFAKRYPTDLIKKLWRKLQAWHLRLVIDGIKAGSHAARFAGAGYVIHAAAELAHFESKLLKLEGKK